MRYLDILARWGLQKAKNSTFVTRNLNTLFLNWTSAFILCLLVPAAGLVLYDFGFRPINSNSPTINFWMKVLLVIISILMGFRLLLEIFVVKKKWARLFGIGGWLLLLVVTFYILPQKTESINLGANSYLAFKFILYAVVGVAFVTEFAYFLRFIYSSLANPGVIFVGSFALLILIGAFLLKLPNASNTHTPVIDAIFTSASAVCVTGLTVVDTATHFTPFGQLIILLLIQVGGLGFMTFAGLLAYAVAGNTSYKSQFALTSVMSARSVGSVMGFIYQVVFITFLIEAIGAACIYFSLDDLLFERKRDKIFFSVFHSVSAFCNAGFSTYTNNLNEPAIKFNYPLQGFIALQIILGGMGFPIVFNLYRFIKMKAFNLAQYLRGSARRAYMPNIIMLNSRLALVVTSVLLAIGFLSYLIFEQAATLAEHPSITGKLVTAFFGSVTPRTAGFNTVNLPDMTLPMVMVYLLLMWIGASPASTGGGIKTTTAGVAFLNMMAILRGKDRTEFFRSEVSFQSIRRAFAIIMLSLFVIGLIIFGISIKDSDKGLINIAFEAFSAFSTVGLTLGITPYLSVSSKLVLTFAMFIGRVGAISLLVLFINQSKQLYYRYPREDIAF